MCHRKAGRNHTKVKRSDILKKKKNSEVNIIYSRFNGIDLQKRNVRSNIPAGWSMGISFSQNTPDLVSIQEKQYPVVWLHSLL